MNDVLPYLTAALSLATALATFVLWMRRPGEDATELVRELQTSTRVAMAAQSARVDVLEERVRHVPTSEELAQLEGEVRALSTSINGIAAQVNSVNGAVRRIEEFLLKNAR